MLENISKSYLRGFIEKTRLKHANTLIGLLNTFSKESLILPPEFKALNFEEYKNVRHHAHTAFQQLRVQVNIPEVLFTVPIPLLVSSSVPGNESPEEEETEVAELNDSSNDGLNVSFKDPIPQLSTSQRPIVQQSKFGQSQANPGSSQNAATGNNQSGTLSGSLQVNNLNPPAPNPNPTPPAPNPNPPTRNPPNQKMANILDIADKLVRHQFDGDAAKLTPFIDALTLLNLQTPADQQITAVAFVKTRLLGEARDCLTNETTLLEVIATLRRNIKVPTSAEVLNKLQGIQHREQTSAEFAKEVDNLAGMLKRAYINEGVALASATSYVTREVTKSLLSNAPTQHAKAVLDAKPFASPGEATAKYVELVSVKPPSASINFFRGNRRGGNNGGRGYHNGNNRNNNRREYRNNNNRGNREYRNNNNRGNREYRNNNNNRHHRDNNSRRVNAYEAAPENDRGPQQPQQQRLGDLQ